MIFLSKLQSLDENELGLLFYILNYLFPTKPEVDEKTILFYKQEVLQGKLASAQKHLTSPQEPVYCSLCNKLNIEIN